MNLDERISELAHSDFQDVHDNEVKQLIRDVLEYVKPERDTRPPNNESVRTLMQGRNHTIEQIEAKIKELGL